MRFLLLASILCVSATALPLPGEIGTPYCFGVGCPCGNDDLDAGCVNSTGQGALLSATGSTSVAADDALFTASQLPRTAGTLLIAGRGGLALPFRDGFWCLGGDRGYRMDKHINSGKSGTVEYSSVISTLATTGVTILPGETWNFQVWYRDAPANLSPCGEKHNMSNGYTVTFTP